MCSLVVLSDWLSARVRWDYMHSLDVVHRDLKAENFVFAAKGSPVVKLIDFGYSMQDFLSIPRDSQRDP